MEAVIFFALGYFVSALISPGSPDLKNPDRILRWDERIFAWRPLPPGTPINEKETVLFAYEMNKTPDSGNNEKR